MGKSNFSLANFAGVVAKTVFNPSKYTLEGDFPATEAGLDITSAEVISRDAPWGRVLELQVELQDGSLRRLPLSTLSSLEEGDDVIPSSVRGLILTRGGEDAICRWDGEKKADE